MRSVIKNHKDLPGGGYIIYISKNEFQIMVMEDVSLFLDINYAVHHLAERLIGKNNNDFLLVVLTNDAMPVADKIAKRLGLNIKLSPAEENTEMTEAASMVSFDYNRINNSERDLPQDFIFHQEQNLRAGLTLLYADTYENVTIKFPEKVVILVDELKYNDDQFHSSLSQRAKQSERISLPLPKDTPGAADKINETNKRFVLLHVGDLQSKGETGEGFDIIIEEIPNELSSSTSSSLCEKAN